MKCDRPGEYRPDSHCQQQSYRGLHSAGRSLSPRPTFNMSTEFEVSVIVRPFSLLGRIKCVWGGGVGGRGKEIKANGRLPHQYPILTSCGQLAQRAKSDV